MCVEFVFVCMCVVCVCVHVCVCGVCMCVCMCVCVCVCVLEGRERYVYACLISLIKPLPFIAQCDCNEHILIGESHNDGAD